MPIFIKLIFLLIPSGWSLRERLDKPCYTSMDLEVYQKRTCCARKSICALKSVSKDSTASYTRRSVYTIYAVVEEERMRIK